jgi:hypothetical protein
MGKPEQGSTDSGTTTTPAAAAAAEGDGKGTGRTAPTAGDGAPAPATSSAKARLLERRAARAGGEQPQAKPTSGAQGKSAQDAALAAVAGADGGASDDETDEAKAAAAAEKDKDKDKGKDQKPEEGKRADKGGRARERIRELSRANKDLVAQVGQLAKQVETLAKRDTGAAATDLKAFLAEVKKNPALLFQEGSGIELKELSEAWLQSTDAETREKAEMKAEVKAIKDALAAEKEARARAEMTVQERAALDAVSGIVGEDKERWERCNRVPNAMRRVMARAQRKAVDQAKAIGRPLTAKEARKVVVKAADKVEKFYEKRASLYAKPSGSSSSKPTTETKGASSDKAQTENQADARPQRVRPRTITSALTGGGGVSQGDPATKLSPREKLTRRIAERRAQA